jgi:transcriptional regulator with XRE-family HTH domain
MQKRYQRTFIRQWRQHRNLTIEQLGERLDMTPSHLSMLERGQRGYTQVTLEAIADALQTDVASLLMRNPRDPDAAIWSLWDQAAPSQREQIVEVVKALLRTSKHH